MQFIVVFKTTPGTTPDKLEPVLPEETMEAWKLIKRDVVRSIWYLAPNPSAGPGPSGNVVMMECADEAEAKRIVDELPLVKRKLVSVDMMHLVPFDGFDLLIKQP